MDSKIKIASQDLLGDVRQIINEGKAQVAMAVNVALSDMYWHIGKRINDELHNERAEYGSQIVATLSRQLQEEFGEQNFSVKNIRRMMQFATEYPDYQNVVSLIRQLAWSHFTLLIPIEDPLKRKFYEQMTINERWSVRTLRSRIDSMLYERTAISRFSRIARYILGKRFRKCYSTRVARFYY